MNVPDDRRSWRLLTSDSSEAAELEATLLGVLAESMPKRSTALVVPVGYDEHWCPEHGTVGPFGGGRLVADDVVPLAQGPQHDHAEHVASIYNEVCPSDNCVEVNDDAILDGVDVSIAAASPSFVGINVIIDATVADKLLSARDHWEAYGCPNSGRFHADILDLILEQVVEWMGLGE